MNIAFPPLWADIDNQRWLRCSTDEEKEAPLTDDASPWKEDLHPRDPEGKFTKKGNGSPSMVEALKRAGFAKDFTNEKETELYHHPSGHSVGFYGADRGASAFAHYLKGKHQRLGKGLFELQGLLKDSGLAGDSE